MPIAALTLELRIEQAHSLKDRRQVVRSLKEKLRNGFNISVAELDEAVTWQSATIGVTAISRSRDYLTGLMQQVENAAVRIANDLGAEVADSWWTFLEDDSRNRDFGRSRFKNTSPGPNSGILIGLAKDLSMPEQRAPQIPSGARRGNAARRDQHDDSG